MDYSRLFNRAFNIVWSYKFLILLGVLAAFSSGTSGDSGFNFELNGSSQTVPFEGGPGAFNWPELSQAMPFLRQLQDAGPAAPAMAVLLACVIAVAGIALYLLGSIARGGLIAGVDAVERGEKVSLGEAWRAGWQRAGTLIGISLLPALPLLVSGLAGLAGFVFYRAGMPNWLQPLGAGMGAVFGILTCVLLPLAFVLGLLRTFANRAAMLEGHGVIAAYSRGFSVLMEHVGQALVIFILQVIVSVLLAVLLLVPGIVVALCFLLWPVIWLFEGFMAAFFSSVWTLAWRRWTGAAKVEDLAYKPA